MHRLIDFKSRELPSWHVEVSDEGLKLVQVLLPEVLRLCELVLTKENDKNDDDV